MAPTMPGILSQGGSAVLLAVRDLVRQPRAVEQDYPRGAIALEDVNLDWAGPLRVRGEARWSDAGLRLRLRLEGEIAPVCARCLGPVPMDISRSLDLLYRPAETMSPDDDLMLPSAEAEIGFFRGEGVELDEVVREQVLLALPMRAICSEDCKGLCPQCGVNLNLETCSCGAGAA